MSKYEKDLLPEEYFENYENYSDIDSEHDDYVDEELFNLDRDNEIYVLLYNLLEFYKKINMNFEYLTVSDIINKPIMISERITISRKKMYPEDFIDIDNFVEDVVKIYKGLDKNVVKNRILRNIYKWFL